MDLDPDYASIHRLSWEDIHRDARALARKAKALGPFLGVVAVARGGLVPAAIIATELELRQVDTVCVSSYGDGSRHSLDVLKRLEGGGAGWLVVDDLADTGGTAKAVRAMLPDARYVTLYAKPAGRHQVDLHVSEFPQDLWLVFPWEDRDPETAL